MDEMTKRVGKFVKDRDWEQFHNPKDLAISLTLESTELMEHFQWRDSQEMKQYIQVNKEGVSEELADVLYWVLLMSHYFNIDLEQVFNDKMDQNERKYPKDKAYGKHDKYTAYQKK